jgi:DNA-binding FrmR family transcriptional regulator
MNEDRQADVLRRLSTIEGHVRAIARMVDEDAYCIDVIRQIQAVQGGLDSVANVVLESHLNTCVLAAIRGDDPAATEQVLGEIAEVFRAGAAVRRR